LRDRLRVFVIFGLFDGYLSEDGPFAKVGANHVGHMLGVIAAYDRIPPATFAAKPEQVSPTVRGDHSPEVGALITHRDRPRFP
jgi:hypothetical protein